MGFGRRFKGLGKLVKKGVRFAAEAGLIGATGGTGISAIAASKLKSRGDKQRTLKAAQDMKRDGLRLQITKGQPTRPPVWAGNTKVIPKGAAKTIIVRGAGADLLSSSEGARRDALRKKSIEGLSATKELELKIGKLTAGQKADLSEAFKREGGGTPAEFKRFLQARL
jgi:hypothetical protein